MTRRIRKLRLYYITPSTDFSECSYCNRKRLTCLLYTINCILNWKRKRRQTKEKSQRNWGYHLLFCFFFSLYGLSFFLSIFERTKKETRRGHNNPQQQLFCLYCYIFLYITCVCVFLIYTCVCVCAHRCVVCGRVKVNSRV